MRRRGARRRDSVGKINGCNIPQDIESWRGYTRECFLIEKRKDGILNEAEWSHFSQAVGSRAPKR